MLRLATQTAELHLNPDPKAICHTFSPFFTLCDSSMKLSSYQMEEDEVFPYLPQQALIK